MKYITGLHALNLPCSLDTCGDWHQSAIQWDKPATKESDGSLYGDYGFEEGHGIPGHSGTYVVANTIRAILDLLHDGQFSIAQGMNKDFICNEKYNNEVFDKVLKMKSLDNWNEIDAFMENEYKLNWIIYKKGVIE